MTAQRKTSGYSCARSSRTLAAFAGAALSVTVMADDIRIQAVHIDQINFRDIGAGGTNSLVAEFTITLGDINEPLPAPQFPIGGFVNVLDMNDPGNPKWLVQNLPICGPALSIPGASEFNYASITTRMDLSTLPGAVEGVSMPVATNLMVDYAPAASLTIPDITARLTPIKNYLMGKACLAVGNNDPVTSLLNGYGRKPDFTGMTWPGPAGNPLFQMKVQASHVNLEAATNQCAPMAVANSLSFLQTSTGLALKNAHVVGWGNDKSLVGTLETFMQRRIGAFRGHINNPPANPALGMWPMDGKLEYIAKTNLAKSIKVKHTSNRGNLGFDAWANCGVVAYSTPYNPTSLPGNANYTNKGVTSTGAGNTYNHNWLIGELQAGNDIEMDLWFRHPDPNKRGRHYVEVVGAGYISRNPFMMHISDHCQSDSDPLDQIGTARVDFEWINGATGHARNSDADIDQFITEAYVAPKGKTYSNLGTPTPIPDGTGATGCGATVSWDIAVPDNFIVAGCEPSFFIPHTFQGDVVVTLTKVGGPSVILVDRPGVPQSTFGFTAANFGASAANPFKADDNAANPYDVPTTPAPGINSPAGSWAPENSLSAFIGINAQGTWRLQVKDCAGSHTGSLAAFKLDLSVAAGGVIPCYANCDGSTTAPVLTANDFQCFLNAYALGTPYANCDGSTVTPVLTANDFQCFLNKFALGCT